MTGVIKLTAKRQEALNKLRNSGSLFVWLVVNGFARCTSNNYGKHYVAV